MIRCPIGTTYGRRPEGEPILDIIRNNDIMESAKPKQNQGLLDGDITCALLSSSQRSLPCAPNLYELGSIRVRNLTAILSARYVPQASSYPPYTAIPLIMPPLARHDGKRARWHARRRERAGVPCLRYQKRSGRAWPRQGTNRQPLLLNETRVSKLRLISQWLKCRCPVVLARWRQSGHSTCVA